MKLRTLVGLVVGTIGAFTVASAMASGGQGAGTLLNFGPGQSASDPSDFYPVMVPINDDGLTIREQLLASAKDSDPIYFLTFDYEWGESTRTLIGSLGKIARRRAALEASGQQIGQQLGEILVVIDAHYAASSKYPREHESLQWLANQWPSHVFVKAYNPEAVTGGLRHAKLDLLEKERDAYITHRKIFVVGSNVIQGGRNTGPMYLEFLNSPVKSFIDVEIFLKDKISMAVAPKIAGSASTPGTSANIVKSMFEETVDNRGVPLNLIIGADPSYVFKSIDVPGGTGTAISGIPAENSIPLVQEDMSKKVFLQPLKYTSDWELLTSDWYENESDHFVNSQGLKDEFRLAIQASINKMRAGDTIYMETPYFIPDLDTYEDLKNALVRGAHIDLLTNSFLTCDGDSKAIPVIMEHEYQMLLSYNSPSEPDRITITYTNKHMVHAKVFGFVTADGQGEMYLGSHNIHLRSGLFDKEVMIHFHWDENQVKQDPSVSNPIDYRAQAWRKIEADYADLYQGDTSNSFGALVPWHSVVDDLVAVAQSPNVSAKVDELFNEPQSAPRHTELLTLARKPIKEMVEKAAGMTEGQQQQLEGNIQKDFDTTTVFKKIGIYL